MFKSINLANLKSDLFLIPMCQSIATDYRSATIHDLSGYILYLISNWPIKTMLTIFFKVKKKYDVNVANQKLAISQIGQGRPRKH